MLKTFKLFKMVQWPDPPPVIPASVRHLEIMACPGLVSLHGLRHLNRLEVLKLGLCSDLSVASFGTFASLRELSLVDVPVRKLRDLDRASSLRRVYINRLDDLRQVGSTGRRQRAMRELDICRCPLLSDISGLASFIHLGRLTLDQLPKLTDLRALAGLEYLTEILIEDCPSLSSVAPLARLASLRAVALNRCPQIRDTHLLSGRQDLRLSVSP